MCMGTVYFPGRERTVDLLPSLAEDPEVAKTRAKHKPAFDKWVQQKSAAFDKHGT
ncbi:MAG: hypothetical protein AAF654_06145 [Myxococcota bacterium]